MLLKSFFRSGTFIALAALIFLAVSAGAQSTVGATNLTGKLMLGYQGWHACTGDGSALNSYIHWNHAGTAPSSSDMVDDIWPDLSEFPTNELFATSGLLLGNGQPAQVYSAYKSATVLRHFKWMQDYGIDGVMLQRFIKDIFNSSSWAVLRNTNMLNVKAGAEAYGRVFCLEYDISNDDTNLVVGHLQSDWATLIGLGMTNSSRYLKHKGKPVVGIWGLGFTGIPSAGAPYSPEMAQTIINYFHAAGCTVMGGVPYNWRTLNNDSQTNAAWTAVYHSFDIINPWSVGRYQNTNQFDSFKSSVVAPDLADCQANGIDYLPVIYPGYSAANLNGGAKNGIPRIGGRFYWRQGFDTISAGCNMLFGAMFDEIDEGTATYKLAPTISTVPVQGNTFSLDIDGESIPNDWYLQVARQITVALRHDVPLNEPLPISPTNTITLTAPLGGGTWTAGNQATVSWTSTGTINGVRIDLSTDGGNTWSCLAYNLANTGSKSVLVPPTASTNCWIRVGENDLTPVSWSTTNFTIQVTKPFTPYHLQPLWNVAPGARSYVTVANGSTPNQRSIAYNALSNQVYVISRTGATSGLTINVLDGTTGADLYQLNTTGISGGSIILVGMRTADDGALYAADMSNNTGGVANFKLYRWANSDSSTVPALVYSGEPANRTDSVRWGDAFDVRGSGTNTMVLIDAQNTNLCAILTPTNAALTGWTSSFTTQDYYPGSIGHSVQFGPTNTFWQKRKADRLQQSTYTLDYSSSPPTMTRTTSATYPFPTSSTCVSAIDFQRNLLALMNFSAITNNPDMIDLYNITDLNNPVLQDKQNFPTNQQPNGNFIGDLVFGNGNLYAIDGNNGISAFSAVIFFPPAIQNQPQSQTNTSGSNATCSVTATGTAPLSYRWQKNGTALTDGGNISGSITTTLTLSNLQASDSASYTVVVTNLYGTVTSSNAVVTVYVPVSVVTPPASRTNNFGTTANFSVAAVGTSPAYRWQKNNSNLNERGNVVGSATSILTLTNVAAADQGTYRVVLTNAISTNISAGATLTVLDPIITSQPANQSVVTNNTAVFHVTVAGTAQFFFQWKKNSTNITDGGHLTGTATSNLTVSSAALSDAASYGVTVSNSNGSISSSSAALTVIDAPPVITTQPQSLTNNAGATAFFTVSATGKNLAYQWFKTSALTNGGTISGATSSALTIANATVTNGGSYTVQITNALGAVTSVVATLTVLYPLPFYEPFAYTNGSTLAGQANAIGIEWDEVGTGTAGPSIAVVSNSLGIAGLQASAGNSIQFGGQAKSARFSFPAGTAVSSGALYYSYILKVTDTNGLTTNGVFVAGFNNSTGTQSAQPSTVGTRLYVRLTNGGFNLGTSKNSSTSTDWVWDTKAYTTTNIIFLVGSYTFNSGSSTDDVARLWINPPSSDFDQTNPTALPLLTTNGTDVASIASFVFLQRVTNEPAAMTVDELRIGSTWASVTPDTGPPGQTMTLTANKHFQLNLSGYTASSAVLKASPDLFNWLPILTNSPFTGSMSFEDLATSNNPMRFFQVLIYP